MADDPDGATKGMSPPLKEELLPPALLEGSRVVVAIVIDGLGSKALDRWSVEGKAGIFDTAVHRSEITSVFPSTTAAGLTTLQTGVPPGQHGMAGYTLYLPEVERVFNMITWKPADGERPLGGPAPDTRGFLPISTNFERLSRCAQDVESSIVSNFLFRDSALTNLHSRGVRYRGHHTPAEFAHLLFREVARPGRRFVSGYWGHLDGLSHSYRPDSPVVELEFRVMEQALRRGLFEPLRWLGDAVAVVLTADHGHVPLPQESRLRLDDFGVTLSRLHNRPAGEPRTTSLALRDERDRERLRDGIGERGAVLDVREAIKRGLYGPPPHHPDLVARIGNTLVIGRGETAFRYADFNSGVIGGHGSLSAEEMLVPLLVWRFGN